MSRYQIFDSHCDTATELWGWRERLDKTTRMVSLQKAQTLSGYGQFFAFCTYPDGGTGYSCTDLLEKPYAYFMDQLEQFRDHISLCRSVADMDAAIEQGKIGAFLALEGAEGINCDPGRLDDLYEMGIRMVNLTWNANNALAGAAKWDGPGLSQQGRDFVRRAQRLGIAVDVSHISDSAFWDVLDVAERPVIASHSNSRSLCGHCRNLTDDQFKALCEIGGYAGINLYSGFLRESGRAELEDVYRHMDHFLTLSGGGNVAMGGDLDGVDGEADLPSGISGLQDYNKLFDYLENKGISKELLEQISSETMKKVVTICTT